MVWESWQRLEPHSNTLYNVIFIFPPAIFLFFQLTVKRIPAICFGLLWFFRSIVWNVPPLPSSPLSSSPRDNSYFFLYSDVLHLFFFELPWRMREVFCDLVFCYVCRPPCFCVEQGQWRWMWKEGEIPDAAAQCLFAMGGVFGTGRGKTGERECV